MKTGGLLRMKPPPCSPKPTSPLAPFAHPIPVLAPSLAVSPAPSIKEHDCQLPGKLEIHFSQMPSFQETPV